MIALVVCVSILVPVCVHAQWVRGYVAPEHEAIKSVKWIDDPFYGRGVFAAGNTYLSSLPSGQQAWVSFSDPGGELIWCL
jgi:hypothetical protein